MLAVVQRLIKQRRRERNVHRTHGVADRADSEMEEARILEGYMPDQLDDAEIASMALEAAVQAGAKGPRDMGRVMGILMPKVKGRAESGRVKAAVTEILEHGRL
ncbi:MAG: GatB/YqeY domain-containing protein [Desulfomicrobium escambiense]|nr:GatB/YqeY domain-containing protein [Desulfomicrobium escambiense]